jgi:hypothetical protein
MKLEMKRASDEFALSGKMISRRLFYGNYPSIEKAREAAYGD